MRILAIRGCNLASLEGEFEIDFTSEPLCSAGIFAITGSTGSGKSTILDAICLALFNNTPRINKVESERVIDVRDTTLTLGDSRNILRRGTGAGYAEVDFVALSGDKYRSRWSVSRAYKKVDGKMGAWNLELTNLTTNEPQQGGKSELLTKIKELIGLTFDQFTRAVMLAQGDFTTFLKADKKEKADLLEKLTGTDIYSRISSKIYDNTQAAKADLEVVQRNIEGVELLNDEQLSAFTEEISTIDTGIKSLEQQEKTQTEKLKWIETNDLLIKNISAAEELLKDSETALDEAKPRFANLARIDSVQGIRDDFKSLESIKTQLIKNRATLEQQQKLEKSSVDKLGLSKLEVERLTKLKTEAEDALKSEQPNIIKARELDIKIEGSTRSQKDAQKDAEANIKLQETTKANIERVTNEIAEGVKNAKELTAWFEENNHLLTIVPKSALILNYIKDANNASKLSITNQNQIDAINGLLEKDNEQFVKWTNEAERLNGLLPAEIATLRSRLLDGEPCPVCGSVHHPISSVTADSVAEEELIKSKEDAAAEIERINKNIKSRGEEIIALKAVVDGYKQQYSAAYTNIEESLESLSDWKVMFEDNTLSAHITKLAKKWQNNEAEQTKLSTSKTLKEQELKNHTERATEVETSLKEKNKKLATYTKELGDLQTQRANLFNGEDVDVVETRLKKSVSDATTNLATETDNFHTLQAKVKEIDGVISQINSNIAEAKGKEHTLQQTVSEWLTTREDSLSFEELSTLLANNSEWVATERAALDTLKDSNTKAITTLAERKRSHDEHKKAEVKPTEEETKESLRVAQSTTAETLSAKRERTTAINVALTNHNNGKERIKKYEKELEQKSIIANNWEKLNGLFGSADGSKFKTIAQGYTLDVLLGYANKRLADITDRYILERVSTESLALQVRDLDMLSEVRPVQTLSGGESFLISLSLALGLSSLSSNRMRIESLFIDEGFGTLDADTLRIAMDALERLRTQGRKIGVISHVAEMTERITAQIQVVKKTNGRGRIEII